MKILGLKFGMEYGTPEERARLRYGKLMLMTDQDNDGHHIKGLIINLFHHFWPSLIENDGFLTSFRTPVVRVRSPLLPEYVLLAGSEVKERSRGKNVVGMDLHGFVRPESLSEPQVSLTLSGTTHPLRSDTFALVCLSTFSSCLQIVPVVTVSVCLLLWVRGRKSFYYTKDMEDWLETLSKKERKSLVFKYYKGLGTSTTEEAKEYFSEFEKHTVPFRWDNGTAKTRDHFTNTTDRHTGTCSRPFNDVLIHATCAKDVFRS